MANLSPESTAFVEACRFLPRRSLNSSIQLINKSCPEMVARQFSTYPLLLLYELAVVDHYENRWHNKRHKKTPFVVITPTARDRFNARRIHPISGCRLFEAEPPPYLRFKLLYVGYDVITTFGRYVPFLEKMRPSLIDCALCVSYSASDNLKTLTRRDLTRLLADQLLPVMDNGHWRQVKLLGDSLLPMPRAVDDSAPPSLLSLRQLRECSNLILHVGSDYLDDMEPVMISDDEVVDWLHDERVSGERRLKIGATALGSGNFGNWEVVERLVGKIEKAFLLATAALRHSFTLHMGYACIDPARAPPREFTLMNEWAETLNVKLARDIWNEAILLINREMADHQAEKKHSSELDNEWSVRSPS